MSDNVAYQLKITLQGSKPPIWRRLQVNGDISLGDLHSTLQIAMGWWDEHLHGFVIDKRRYGEPDPYFPDDVIEEYETPLASVVKEKSKFTYIYDFGDNWRHDIVVEKVLAVEERMQHPLCLDGKGACPPEDCGGISGYEMKLAILRKKRHPEHEEMFEIFGEDYDPAAFDCEAVNRELEKAWSGSGNGNEVTAIPDYSAELLAQLEVDELLDELLEHADRVPRNLIDACVARGDAMIEVLQEWLDVAASDEDDDDGAWWLLHHAAMIAGLVPTVLAGELLLSLMHHLEEQGDETMQEWLAGTWPTLFANKSAAFATQLRAIAEDRSYDFFVRNDAAASVLSLAQRAGEPALEEALDWLAALVQDEQSDWTTRSLFAGILLEFPRERFRPLLLEVAKRQEEEIPMFDAESIEQALTELTNSPEWERFANPWQFYEREAIETRQQRWAEEARELLPAYDSGLDEFDDDDAELQHYHEPYIRAEPKVGRNDPCPCGSGKKYKNCCLVLH